MNLFCFFHLNMAFSSIEEEQRPEVIRQCYWPILRLAERLQIPLGIEASGYTLSAISQIDPDWIDACRRLVGEGPCELIGSGLSQMIGPLVPASVNAANLRLGNKVYQDLLGLRPRIALLGEQAFSAGLVPIYLQAGYQGIIAEWNNAAQAHPEWPKQWRYYPQQAVGTEGQIPVIWNESIAFQKFQRFTHGEAEKEEYDQYLDRYAGEDDMPGGAFPLYGSDAEVFDFRPSRYATEASREGESEWIRIERLLIHLKGQGRRFIRPSDILQHLSHADGGHRLTLGSAALPVPVKKQGKYNLLRWAVTGRADFDINTRCWKICEAIESSPATTDAEWAELCYLWSSDFRTHITDSRWAAYRERLRAAEARYGVSALGWRVASQDTLSVDSPETHSTQTPDSMRVDRQGRFLSVEGNRLRVRFNCRRGLALDQFTDLESGPEPLMGTIPHGHFEEINLGADFYSGHLVFESPGCHKVTDLERVDPEVICKDGAVTVSATVQTGLGPVKKTWTICDQSGTLRLSIDASLDMPGPGSLRLGHLTLLPGAFDQAALFYRTHNGGALPETFLIEGCEVQHGNPVSSLVSASHAIGITEGSVELGDSRTVIRVEVDKASAAVVGLLTHRASDPDYLYRLAFSAREIDDSSRGRGRREVKLRIKVSATRSGAGEVFVRGSDA